MVREYHPRLAVACSFQKEASVILDMLVYLKLQSQHAHQIATLRV